MILRCNLGKTLKKLKKHPGVWRVDGYNNIDFYENSAPRVFVSLAQIEEKGLDSPLVNGKATGKQMWVKEPLSRLSDLLIGSCWRGGEESGGKRVNRLPSMQKTFLVDTSQIQLVRINEPIKLDGVTYRSALPSGAIWLGGNYKYLKQSFYAVVPVLEDKRTKFLVVSCYELYRVYLGVSTRFTNSIVRGDLGQYFSWNEPKLKVNARLSRVEQFVAYRGHFNEEGRNWFYSPSNYLRSIRLANQTATKQSQKPLVLKATFPFSGLTRLTVAGKAFKNDSSETDEKFVWCVFAANILKCSKSTDFDTVQVESDPYSTNPLPWDNETGADQIGDESPFDDEDPSEDDEQPTVNGPRIALLNSNNFFDAMNNIRFKHTHTDGSRDPVYEHSSGVPIDVYSSDEVDSTLENEKAVAHSSEFDSHTDTVSRELSDFVKTCIVLRELVVKRGWKVRTRARGSSMLTVEGEIVTTFLNSKNRRRRWHLINYGTESERLRQVAWVEIAISDNQFVYLIEMELTGNERSRSTLCIAGKNYGYMDEEDFKVFLEITAVQNSWPQENHHWKNEKAETAAEKHFSCYTHERINHPANYDPDSKKGKNISKEQKIVKWASDIEERLQDIIG